MGAQPLLTEPGGCMGGEKRAVATTEFGSVGAEQMDKGLSLDLRRRMLLPLPREFECLKAKKMVAGKGKMGAGEKHESMMCQASARNAVRSGANFARVRFHILSAYFWLSVLTATVAAGQAPSANAGVAIAIHGRVTDSGHRSQANVTVRLEPETVTGSLETKSDAAGAFTFSISHPGAYSLIAEKSGRRSSPVSIQVTTSGAPKPIELVLDLAGRSATPDAGNPAASASAPEMEFADKPNFTVAGITDWTAVGGHGSDSILRTSEALARDTQGLRPEGAGQGAPAASVGGGDAGSSEAVLRAAVSADPKSFAVNRELGLFYLHAGRFKDAVAPLESSYRIEPKDRGNELDLVRAYQGAGNFASARLHVKALLEEGSDANADAASSAELYRLAGELDEKLGDPLGAVRELEHAVRLEPSEANYFAWGSELLLHRAIWQAVEVFESGLKAYPKSARIETALGTALFAGARYEDAARRLCAASDLDPGNPEPYLFMGKIGMVAPTSDPCLEKKLARFVHDQPENSLANYLYAMTILKRQEQASDPQALAQVESLLNNAVKYDSKCADGYLQLGILSSSRRSFDKAIGFYTKAIEANPQLADAHYRLGVAYDRTGAREKAEAEFHLHDDLVKQQSAQIEAERREVKQFLVVLDREPASPPAH
jgi:tetratricopeptide (TPR) repeat protein